jgi:hypothetical protein
VLIPYLEFVKVSFWNPGHPWQERIGGVGKRSQETGVIKQWKQDDMEPLLRVSRFVDSWFSSEAGEV